MREFAMTALRKQWWLYVLGLVAIVAWVMRPRPAGQFLDTASVGALVVDMALLLLALTPGLVAAMRTTKQYDAWPRKMSVTVQERHMVNRHDNPELHLDFNFEGGQIRLPMAIANPVRPGDTIVFTYRPCDALHTDKRTIYRGAQYVSHTPAQSAGQQTG